MNKISRRKFLDSSSKASLAGTVIFASNQSIEKQMKNVFKQSTFKSRRKNFQSPLDLSAYKRARTGLIFGVESWRR